MLFSFLNCNGAKEKKPIDYSNLDTLNTGLIKEIGKGKILGSLENLVVNSKGTLLVFAESKMSIEQFSADGTYIGTVAHQGKGPGEIPDISAMFMANDTLVVQLYPSRILSLYKENHDSLYTFAKSVVPASDEKPIDVRAYAGYNEFWGTVVKNFKTKSENNPRYWQNVLVIVNEKQEILQDSVNLLKKPNPGAFFSKTGMPLGYLGFPQADAFEVLNDSLYMIARSEYGTLLSFNNKNEKVKTIELNVKPRPVTKEDIAVSLKDLPSAWKKSVEKHIPAYKPAFVNMWITNNYIWLYTGEVNKKEQFVVFTRKGKALGEFLLPLEANVQQIRNKKVYTIYNSKKGDRIRIYKIDL